jgi:outer membrane protein assembly factor BamB
MTDLREALGERVRSFQPEPGGFERVTRRRRRKDVRRKIETYAVVLLLVAIGTAGAIALQHQRRSIPMITPDNVGTLHTVWTGHVSGTPSTPAIADGMVYVTADRLYAFPITCATSDDACPPIWTAAIGTTPAGAPVVVDGVVLVTSTSGLFAFDSTCSAPTCSAMWTAPSPGYKGQRDLNSHKPVPYPQFSVPAVVNGTVYAAGGRGLYAFALRCRNDGGLCAPSWIGKGLGSYDPPAIGIDAIYVATERGVDAYAPTCPARLCDPVYQLGRTTLTGGDPSITAVGGDVYTNTMRFASEHDIRRQNPAWRGEVDRPSTQDPEAPYVGHVAVADGHAYMTASRLYAYPVDCGSNSSSCRPVWIGPRQFDEQIQKYRTWSDPVVSNGLVFSSTDRPYAFGANCATGGEECRPLWVGPAGFGSAPAVTGNALAVTYVDGRVVLFEASGA